MIAHCGLDCSQCEAYQATRDDDQHLRQVVAEQWSRQYQADIRPEMINCAGCQGQGQLFYFSEHLCPLRQCNRKRGTATCARCSDYPCPTVTAFIQQAPAVGKALEALRTGGDT